MSSRSWRFGWGRYYDVDLFTERNDTDSETLSQAIRAAAEEPSADGSVLFGVLKGTVVGLRYYTGVVNKGEMVGLVREPTNPYDRNAVMVTNIYGRQVGHIRKELAAAMAHVMDNKMAKVEGVVHSGTQNTYSMPVMLSFWGPEEQKDAVMKWMGRLGFKLNASGNAFEGGNKKSGGSASTSSSQYKKGWTVPLTAEQLKNSFDTLFNELMESKEGEKEAAESVGTRLLPHQKQALSWMCAQENRSLLPPFWEKRGELYFNSATGFSAKEIPERVRGGILADDMGLGKTLTTIALILTNFHNGKPLPVSVQDKNLHIKGSSRDDGAESSKLPEEDVICLDAVETDEQTSQAKKKSTKRKNKKGSSRDDGAESSKIPEEDVICLDAVETDEQTSQAKKKSTKRKNKKDCVLVDDFAFAAALSGSTSSDGGAKKKKTAKNKTNVESLIPENADDLSATATLIICPLSVLSNWLDQFEQHVRSDVQLNVYLYYGAERNRSQKFLSSQDVVVTTYNVLSADFGNKSPLHAISWLRVVLDEGHVIRNPNAQMSKAVLQLKAQRRWILSGTPIQNGVKDLWMLLAFLRLKPFDVREWWNRVILRPVTQGDRTGLQNLQTLVKSVTLRRTKNSSVNGRPLVVLPEKKVFVEQVELSQEEREEYELARSEGRNTIGRYVAEGSVMRNYAHVLVILMRLRQLCCHPDLIEKLSSDLGASSSPSELRERLMEKLRMVLSSGSDEECSVCLDSVRLPVITRCAHVYCRPCIARVISMQQQQQNAVCPLCRSEIKASELVEFPQEEVGDESSTSSGRWRNSSKVQALMGNLLQLRCEDSSVKSLVVSQFTRFLSILEQPLREKGFSFVRLDGSMSQKQRVQVIEQFQSSDPGGPTVMLLSLKAGGVGINLTAASRVFLMDPAWNPATEEQCIDRCHRLGQDKDVIVTKFIVKNSVEENMVKIQRQKQDVVEKAFGSSSSDRSSARLQDLKALMEL